MERRARRLSSASLVLGAGVVEARADERAHLAVPGFDA
jgi:hypothetical protein